MMGRRVGRGALCLMSCGRRSGCRPGIGFVGWARASTFGFVREAMAPHHARGGRPSIDPELMVRRPLAGCLHEVRSERRPCGEVDPSLAHRWSCRPGVDARSPDHSTLDPEPARALPRQRAHARGLRARGQAPPAKGLASAEHVAVDGSEAPTAAFPPSVRRGRERLAPRGRRARLRRGPWVAAEADVADRPRGGLVRRAWARAILPCAGRDGEHRLGRGDRRRARRLRAARVMVGRPRARHGATPA